MTSVGAISLPVVLDVNFIVLATLGASVVAPLMGAMFLGMWCRMMNVPTASYRRRCLAYAAGCLAALATATVMMLLVKDSSKVPGWFLASLFLQALALHALIVPLVLKTPWGKEILAQALALMLYGAVLVIALAPVIIRVRKAVDRAEWKADLEQLYRTVTAEKGVDAGRLPETLAVVEQAGRKIVLLPAHRTEDVVYLGDYVQQNCPAMPQGAFVSSMGRIGRKRRETSPLIWQNPTDRKLPRAVCSYDGTVVFLTRPEFDYHLDRTLLELDKTEPPTTTPDSDQP
jgi:hypothetical protein